MIIALLSKSTLYPASRVQFLANAIAAAGVDFGIHWDIPTDCVTVPDGAEPPATWAQLILEDDPPPAPNYAGLHTVTAAGMPIGHVYVAVCQKFGMDVNVAAFHEWAEMQVDRKINEWAMDRRNGYLRSKEVGDPVNNEAMDSGVVDELGNPIYVSNYVLPSYYDFQGAYPWTAKQALGWHPGEPQHDDLAIDGPFKLGPGGYATDLINGVYTPVYGDLVPDEARTIPYWSRRAARQQ